MQFAVTREEHDAGIVKDLPKLPQPEETFDFGEEEEPKVEDAKLKQELKERFANYSLIYSKDSEEVKLTDFQVVNMIGKGSISNVYLVKRKTDGQPFAMKCIQKELILSDDLFKSTKLEKDVLIRVSLCSYNYLLLGRQPFLRKTPLFFLVRF